MGRKAIIFDWIGVLSDGSKGRAYSFSADVLGRLKKNYKLGLVSLAGNGNGRRENEIRESGLLEYFDAVVVDSEKTHFHYLRCMEKMDVRVKETLIVDDRTVRGIEIGNKLGCETVWVRKGHYPNELPNEKTGNPSYVIDTIEELEGVLGR